MGLCTKRRVYVLFLAIAVIQIVTTGVRQFFDFLGPLWTMICTNFLNIVFDIFGFFGGYTLRKHYLLSYAVWSAIWASWNAFIVCLYIPIPSLQMYKSTILSLGTGGFSWWETGAPGCSWNWKNESERLVTNCMLNPKLVECIQAGIQVVLALAGIIASFCLIVCPISDSEKDSKDGPDKVAGVGNTVPPFLSLSRSGGNRNSSAGSVRSASSRLRNHTHGSQNNVAGRAPISIPGTSDTAEGVTANAIDDRLRPMTPRRVKRRSARSIQSQRFGPGHNHIPHHQLPPDRERDPFPKASGSNSARNSLRSNASSRRSAHHRNSKRKMNHFVSPVNRLMQQQVDSETSHDDPPPQRYPLRDQGHVNPVYLGPQSPQQPPPPPRPPSARSSYSNYHPARLPSSNTNANPNVFNLNQNIFANPAFDNTTEYNASQHSNNTNTFYEDDIQFHPDLSSQNHIPHPQMPRQNHHNPNNFTFAPSNLHKDTNTLGSRNENPTLVYPLAHSPVSQESFPMWGMAQAQVPTNHSVMHQYAHQPRIPNPYQSPPHPNRPFNRQPINSETVI